MGFTIEYEVLRCVKAIESCPELEVGDLLIRLDGNEIHAGGYEYVVTNRVSDWRKIKFRVEHLEDCFELDIVKREIWA